MTLTTVLVLGGLVLAVVAPARAEHAAAAPTESGAKLEIPGTEHSLDINLKLGLNSFRLGSRLFGRDGFLGGAWLNGETRSDGFSLDGRIEHDECIILETLTLHHGTMSTCLCTFDRDRVITTSFCSGTTSRFLSSASVRSSSRVFARY